MLRRRRFAAADGEDHVPRLERQARITRRADHQHPFPRAEVLAQIGVQVDELQAAPRVSEAERHAHVAHFPTRGFGHRRHFDARHDTAETALRDRDRERPATLDLFGDEGRLLRVVPPPGFPTTAPTHAISHVRFIACSPPWGPTAPRNWRGSPGPGPAAASDPPPAATDSIAPELHDRRAGRRSPRYGPPGPRPPQLPARSSPDRQSRRPPAAASTPASPSAAGPVPAPPGGRSPRGAAAARPPAPPP